MSRQLAIGIVQLKFSLKVNVVWKLLFSWHARKTNLKRDKRRREGFIQANYEKLCFVLLLWFFSSFRLTRVKFTFSSSNSDWVRLKTGRINHQKVAGFCCFLMKRDHNEKKVKKVHYKNEYIFIQCYNNYQFIFISENFIGH